MKSTQLFYTLILLFLNTTLPAQNPLDPGWQWAVRGGSSAHLISGSFDAKYERIMDVAVDTGNNYYYLAEVGGYHFTLDTMEFDTYNDVSGTKDIYIFSTDSEGNYRWSKTIGGAGYDYASSLGLDNQGNVYVSGDAINIPLGAGPYNTSVHFDTDSIMPEATSSPSPANKKIFIIKYDSEGNFQWLRQPEDTAPLGYSGAMLNMIVEPDGTTHSLIALVAGTYFDGQLTIPPMDTIGNITPKQSVIITYDSAGVFEGYMLIDMKPIDGRYNFQFAYDPNLDRYYIGDTYRSTPNPDNPLSINGFGFETIDKAFYLSAVSSAGDVLWYHENELLNGPVLGDIKIDDEGNVYFAGYTGAPDNFAGYVFDQEGGASSSRDPFLVKLDPDGNLLWGSNADLSSGFPGQSIVVKGNDVYLGLGMLYNTWDGLEIQAPLGAGWVPDIQIIRFDAQTGVANEVIHNNMLTPTRDAIMAMALDNKGDLVVGGYFGSDLFYGSDFHLHNSAQDSDFFIAKYCPAPRAAFSVDTLALIDASYAFTFTGSNAFIDSVAWNFGDSTAATGTNAQHSFAENGTYTVCAIVYNHCSSDTACIALEVDGLVSVATVEKPDELKIYPNPTTGQLTLKSETPLSSYTFSDLQGRKVAKGKIENNRIDFSKFESGVYLLQVRGGGGAVWNLKVVKE